MRLQLGIAAALGTVVLVAVVVTPESLAGRLAAGLIAGSTAAYVVLTYFLLRRANDQVAVTKQELAEAKEQREQDAEESARQGQLIQEQIEHSQREAERRAQDAERAYRESLRARCDLQGPIVIVEIQGPPDIRIDAIHDGQPNAPLGEWIEAAERSRWQFVMSTTLVFHNYGATPALVSVPSIPVGDYELPNISRILLVKPGEQSTLSWSYIFTGDGADGHLRQGGWHHELRSWNIQFIFTSSDPYRTVADTHTLDVPISPFEVDGSRFRVLDGRCATTGVSRTERDYPKLRDPRP